MPRLDRLLTLYCFSLLRKIGPAEDLATPILMYHSISNNTEHEAHPYYRINTSPTVFADHIRFLTTQGYRTIGLQELTKRDSDSKRVVITFDDGFSDFYYEAFPILKDHGFRATVFLITALVGREPFKGRRCLNWDQIRELYLEGVVFGSHSHTHPQLVGLPREAIVQELRRSKNIIEDKLGCTVTEFSYPYRFPEENSGFKEFIGDELRNAGYSRCVTTTIGRYRAGESAMFIKRLPANDLDDTNFFKAKIEGAYDWLYYGQIIAKRTRNLVTNNRLLK